MRKLDTKQFIEKHELIHGQGTALYDRAVYINNRTEIELGCGINPDHGYYHQMAGYSFRGAGCPKCKEEKSLTLDLFIKKDLEVHGVGTKLYDRVMYKGLYHKVELGCPTHGYYWQMPFKSLTGQGCRKCGHKKTQQKSTIGVIPTKVIPNKTNLFIEKNQKANGLGKNTYDRLVYKNSKTKVELGCGADLSHGYYFITPNNSLNGHGCPKCARAKLTKERVKTTEQFVEDHMSVHGVGQTIYDRVVYVNAHTKVELGCGVDPTHGYYWMKPNNSLNSAQGCPKCGSIKSIKTRTDTQEDFLTKLSSATQNPVMVDRVDYVNTSTKVWLGCGIKPEHGYYLITPHDALGGHGCPKCAGNVSKPEKEISEFLTELEVEHETSIRSVISPLELDIYIPSKNIAIEYCGLYWHSEIYRDSNYHYTKWKMCKDKGIQLLTIYEDEWLHKKEVVKRLISNKVGKVSQSVFARKCEFIYTTKLRTSILLNEHHIQGESTASYYTGLTLDGRLVAVALFTSRGNGYELVRYCSSVRVVGGLTKLVKNFRKNHPGTIHTFADHRYSAGPLYLQAGFTARDSIPQDYRYIVKGRTLHKFAFRHKSLSTKLKKYDPAKTEHENCLAAGILRIYDCGKTRYVLA